MIRIPIAAIMACSGALIGPVLPTTAAQPCPDIEVTFARGTGEAPGIGPTGDAFVNALRPRAGGRSVGVYAVNYPATDDWPTGVDGVRDAGAHIESMAAACPHTAMVLGGFSQGAAVAGFVTSDAVPAGVDPATVPKPLQPDVANHVSSVVLFGKPNVRAMNLLGEPPVMIGPLYAGKTIELCATNDPVCSDGLEFAAHNSYASGGFVERAATFAVNHL